MLQAQNHELVSPSDRSHLHPLVIPLAAHQSSHRQSERVYTCLLRQVTLSGASDQVGGGGFAAPPVRCLSSIEKQGACAGHACGSDVTPVTSFELGCSQLRRVLA